MWFRGLQRSGRLRFRGQLRVFTAARFDLGHLSVGDYDIGSYRITENVLCCVSQTRHDCLWTSDPIRAPDQAIPRLYAVRACPARLKVVGSTRVGETVTRWQVRMNIKSYPRERERGHISHRHNDETLWIYAKTSILTAGVAHLGPDASRGGVLGLGATQKYGPGCPRL